MVVDIIVVGLILGLALSGYRSGFFGGLDPVVTLMLGVTLALRKCTLVASWLTPLLHNDAAARVAGFLLILASVWLAMRLCRSLLAKLVDWRGLQDLDHYFGAVLGLAKGTALVWLVLSASLIVYPASVRFIEHSRASMRVLGVGERIISPEPERGAATAVNVTGDFPESGLALLRPHYDGADRG